MSKTSQLRELWSRMGADGMDGPRLRDWREQAQRWPWQVHILPNPGDLPFYQRLEDVQAWCHQQMGPPGNRWVWWMIAAIPHDAMTVRFREVDDHTMITLVWR
jgi:hypothetical protein